MDLERFDLERWQSVHEHDVDINLSESGVHPLRLQEIVETADLDDLLGQELGYTQTNGTIQLRERVAALYDGASAANVLVTNGGSEANFVTCWHLIEPGDEVVVIQPTYMQIPGLVRSFGATVREVWLEDGHGDHGMNDQTPMRWRLDLDAVRGAVTPRTRCIAVCNPNNPSGTVVARSALEKFLDAVPASVLVVLDEAYFEYAREDASGEYTDGVELARGRRNVVVLRTFSKAYGLAGLRVGYAVGDPSVITALRKVRIAFAVNSVAQHAALASLAARNELLARTDALVAERERVRDALVGMGYDVPQSEANFVFMPLGDRSVPFAEGAAEVGVLLRAYGSDGVRITIGDPHENDTFLKYASSAAPQ